MNQISLDSAEMKTFLHHMITNNRHLQEQGKTPLATEIIGDSGLGKTSIAIQLATELGLDSVKLNLAQIEELGDLVGFPIRQFEMVKAGQKSAPLQPSAVQEVKKPQYKFVKEMVNGQPVMKKVLVEPEITSVPEQKPIQASGQAQWIDENAVEEYTRLGYEFTGNKRMSYCPPEWIADKTGGGLLILDDWNRADQRFIQAVMELVDRQEYISWKLPKDWHILLTANPDNGDYIVNSIDVAQRTRFISTILKWNAERWAEWAETSSIDGRCINFVLMHPEIVGENKGVNSRSLTRFFDGISSFDNFNQRLPMIQMMGEGSVGPEVTTMFTSFINNKLDKLITPHDMLLHESTTHVISEIDSVVNEGSKYRADLASILATRLINFALVYANKNTITPEILERLAGLIRAEVFTNDLKYVIAKKVVAGNKAKFGRLAADPVVQEYITKL